MGLITGPQMGHLSGALLDAFRTYDNLERFLLKELDTRLTDYADRDGWPQKALQKLVDEADRLNWVGRLIVVLDGYPGGNADSPERQVVRDLAQRFRGSPTAASGGARIDYELTDLARYDLREIEWQFRKARLEVKEQSLRLVAAAIHYDEDPFVASLRGRIEHLLCVKARPTMVLDGVRWTSARVLDVLKKLVPLLQEQAVLCFVRVTRTDLADDLAGLWSGVDSALRPAVGELVLVFLVPPELPVPAGIIRLPTPAPSSEDLMVWADEIGRALVWPQERRDKLVADIMASLEAMDESVRIWELYNRLFDIVDGLRTGDRTALNAPGS